MNISRIDSKEEYPSSIRMNISRIDYLGKHKMNPLGEIIGSGLLLSGIR